MNIISQRILEAITEDRFPGTEIINEMVCEFNRKPSVKKLVPFLKTITHQYQHDGAVAATYGTVPPDQRDDYIEWDAIAKEIRETCF